MAKISDKDWCWQQCATINNENPDVYRTDELGNKIRYASYGTNGEFGWHIDHRKPISKDGSDHRKNLRALHWRTNIVKSNKYPHR